MRISYTEPCTTVIPIQLRHCVTGGRFTGRRAAGTAGGAKRVSSGGLGEAVSLVGEDISLWIDYDMFGKLHHNKTHPKLIPKLTQNSPKLTQINPKVTQNHPNSSKLTSNSPQTHPKPTQNSLKLIPNSPKLTQNSPKTHPKLTPNPPQIRPKLIQTHSNSPRNSPKTHLNSP